MVGDYEGTAPFDDIPETGTLMRRSFFQICRTRSGFRPLVQPGFYAIRNFILHIATKIVTSLQVLKNHTFLNYLYFLL